MTWLGGSRHEAGQVLGVVSAGAADVGSIGGWVAGESLCVGSEICARVDTCVTYGTEMWTHRITHSVIINRRASP
eukprot:3720633-Pleurochrysis_carterae.AAC.1